VTIINLETTQFKFAEVVDYLAHYTTILWQGNYRSVKNFCVVLVGDVLWDEVILGNHTDYPVVFRCPADWDIAQIMHALGAHKSLEAARSQWYDTTVPHGITELLVKIKGTKGALTLFKDSTTDND